MAEGKETGMSPSKKTALLSAGISLVCLLYLLQIIPSPFSRKELADAIDKGVAVLFIVGAIIAFGAFQWDFQVARKKRLLGLDQDDRQQM
jgi:hypothetical protein